MPFPVFRCSSCKARGRLKTHRRKWGRWSLGPATHNDIGLARHDKTQAITDSLSSRRTGRNRRTDGTGEAITDRHPASGEIGEKGGNREG